MHILILPLSLSLSLSLSLYMSVYVCLSQVVFKDNIQIVTQERVVQILKKSQDPSICILKERVVKFSKSQCPSILTKATIEL